MSGEIASLSERRWPMSPLMEIQLHADRLEAWRGAGLERRIALETVEEVRLSVEMGGEQSLVVCRVTGASGEIAFSSRRAESGGWFDNALEFQRLLVALHKQLGAGAGTDAGAGTGARARTNTVRFVEGQSLKFRLIMSGAGVALLAIALAFSAYMLLSDASAMLALAGAPFALTGGALAWIFRPGRPVPYDPQKLIERFGG